MRPASRSGRNDRETTNPFFPPRAETFAPGRRAGGGIAGAGQDRLAARYPWTTGIPVSLRTETRPPLEHPEPGPSPSRDCRSPPRRAPGAAGGTSPCRAPLPKNRRVRAGRGSRPVPRRAGAYRSSSASSAAPSATITRPESPQDEPAPIAPPRVHRPRREAERDGPDDQRERQHEAEVVEHQQRHRVRRARRPRAARAPPGRWRPCRAAPRARRRCRARRSRPAGGRREPALSRR